MDLFGDRLTELCRRELAAQVGLIFRRAPDVRAALAEIGMDMCASEWCTRGDPYLRRHVVRAVIAREKFHRTKPAWAPELPLRWADCEALASDVDYRLKLMGWWATSLCGRWRLGRRHPTFYEHARASMACKWLPEPMRQDEGLNLEFPPQALTDRRYRGVVLNLAGEWITARV